MESCHDAVRLLLASSGTALDEELVGSGAHFVAERAAAAHADERRSPLRHDEAAGRPVLWCAEHETRPLASQRGPRRWVYDLEGNETSGGHGVRRQSPPRGERFAGRPSGGELVDVAGGQDRLASNRVAQREGGGYVLRSAIHGDHAEPIRTDEAKHVAERGVIARTKELSATLCHHDSDLARGGCPERAHRSLKRLSHDPRQGVAGRGIERNEPRIAGRARRLKHDVEVLSGHRPERVLVPVARCVDFLASDGVSRDEGAGYALRRRPEKLYREAIGPALGGARFR